MAGLPSSNRRAILAISPPCPAKATIAGIRGLMSIPIAARPDLNRRTLVKAAGLAALAGISACGTVTMPTGEGAGASSSATATLAGIRAAAGLPALTPDAQLEQAALQQAGYMASRERMSHTTGWGKDFASRMKDNGVRGAAAENIAAGRFDQQKLFDIWMHSDGHRRNMLDPDLQPLRPRLCARWPRSCPALLGPGAGQITPRSRHPISPYGRPARRRRARPWACAAGSRTGSRPASSP